MKVDHIALYVKDLEGIKKFYEKYFGTVSNEKYYNNKTGLETYFLTFEDGARLEIMTKPNIDDKKKDQIQYGYNHIAFNLGSKQRVDELTDELRMDGYIIICGPRTTGDGYYESCVLDTEGNLIELVC